MVCPHASLCFGNCPDNVVCPFEKEIKEYQREQEFYYWASEQNRAEDSVGYSEWLESIKNTNRSV